jgi:hypothetical protein
MGDEYVRRFVLAADWGATEGRIFDLSPVSILDPTPDLLSKIRYRMKLHRVYDHGEFSPSACLWYATDEKENVFFYREYMAENKLVSEHRDAIYKLSKLDNPGGGNEPPAYHTNYADPVIFNKTRGRTVNAAPQWSVADEWVERRIVDPKTAVWWRRAVNDEAATINRVREYLRRDYRHQHPFTGQFPSPRAFFLRKTDDYPYGCHEVLTDIRAARRVEVGTMADGSKLYGDERDEKVRDHLLDCVRYALIMRPSPAKEADAMQPAPPGHIRIDEYRKETERWDAFQATEDRRKWRGKFDY